MSTSANTDLSAAVPVAVNLVGEMIPADISTSAKDEPLAPVPVCAILLVSVVGKTPSDNSSPTVSMIPFSISKDLLPQIVLQVAV